MKAFVQWHRNSTGKHHVRGQMERETMHRGRHLAPASLLVRQTL